MIIFCFPLFQPFPTYFGLKLGHNGVLIFFTFFATFLEFYITRRVGTKRNYNFYFQSFSAFSNLFWLEMKPPRYFLNFFIFWLFYWNFILRVGLERNGTITFVFLRSHPFPTYFGLKWTLMIFFNFYNFFAIFFGIFYYATGRNEMERKFLFSPFPGLPNLVWLEMKP